MIIAYTLTGLYFECVKTLTLLLPALLLFSGCHSDSHFDSPYKETQKNILWIWDRPTDVRFLDSTTFEFAMLSKTFVLYNSHIKVIPRHSSVQIPPQASLFPVIRIESRGGGGGYNSVITEKLIEEILFEFKHFSKARILQIDFDAKKSELSWYKNVLTRIKTEIQPKCKLSITALVSWCYESQWLESLPVDEIVPMVFQMGYHSEKIKQEFQNKPPFQKSNLKYSIGCSIDEPLSVADRTKRMYFFNPAPWTKETIIQISKYN